jgi:DNA-binding GntR family transcriptional regulator
VTTVYTSSVNGSDGAPQELPSLAGLFGPPEDGSARGGGKRKGRSAIGVTAVDRQTLSDRVYEQIRNAILRGEVPDGTELNQVELANALGVSRVPVREALRRLQAERLLDASPFQRCVVTSLSKAQVLEFYDLRQELEVFGVLRSRAREDFASVLLPDARETAAKLSLDQNGEDWFQADLEFHRVLNGRGSGTASIVDEIRFRIYRYRHLAEPNIERREQVIAEHAGILSAVEGGDPGEIRAAIETHIGGTRTLIERVI